MTTEAPAARAVMDRAEPLANRNAPAPHARAPEALSWNLWPPIRSPLRPRIDGSSLCDNACLFLPFFFFLFVGPGPDVSARNKSGGGGRYIVSTARKRALPSTTRWYALGASANG